MTRGSFGAASRRAPEENICVDLMQQDSKGKNFSGHLRPLTVTRAMIVKLPVKG